jgi:peptidoglycan/LPS O-acetylase OafA/YrhL
LLYFLYLGNMTSVLTPTLQPVQPSLNLGHLWSLAVEEQFYMVWPFIVWGVRDRKKLLAIVTTVLLAGPALRFLLLSTGSTTFTINRLLITRADSLLFGAGLALLLRGPAGRHLPVRRVLLLSSFALTAILFLSHGPSLTSLWILTLGYSAIAAVATCLVYLAQAGNNRLSRFLDNRTLRFFGKYSYGLYIFHGFFFVLIRQSSAALEGVLHSGLLAQAAAACLGFGLTIGLAMLSFHLFEEPILRLKHRFA